jgi:pimeloyl-ACP methyl ester carboxylesterase
VLHLDQTFSRSDPVPQPTSAQDGVNDLVALLKAADVPGPYVLVAHSMSGMIARVFAGEHPDEVKGIVFVDATTPEFRAQMTPEAHRHHPGQGSSRPTPMSNSRITIRIRIKRPPRQR